MYLCIVNRGGYAVGFPYGVRERFGGTFAATLLQPLKRQNVEIGLPWLC